MLVDHLLQLIGVETNLVDENMVVHRTRGALNGRVGIQIEVVFERMGNVALNKSTWVRVTVSIASGTGKETDVVSLRGDNHNEFALFMSESVSRGRM